jgi:MFS transporter, FSR family, fosmidomycin resistance protein
MVSPEPLIPAPARAPVPSPASSPALRSTTAVALAVAIAHGTNDAYSAFLHPLLPRIMERLDLSIALAATLAMTLSLAASVVQPVMGYLADRYGRRLFVVAGPLLSAVFLSLIGVAPTFLVLALFLALGGLGSAMFHPPGASMAARVGAGRGSGMRASFFSFGGALGYAAGPLTAVGIVSVVGLEGLWVAMLPMLVLAVVLWRVLPPDRPDPLRAPPPGVRTVLRALRGPLGVVFGISAVAAFVQRVYLTMQPISIAAAGVARPPAPWRSVSTSVPRPSAVSAVAPSPTASTAALSCARPRRCRSQPTRWPSGCRLARCPCLPRPPSRAS